MIFGISAALLASFFWTVSSSLWCSLSTSLTATQINALKNAIALVIFLPLAFWFPFIPELRAIVFLLISGGVGIAIGDCFYIAALRRLGTRRTLTVESIGPLVASFTGIFLIGEYVPLRGFIGALLVGCSLVIAAFQNPPELAALGAKDSQTQGGT